MIPFSKPTVTGYETEYVAQAIDSGYLSGDGPFTKKCHQWFEEHLKCEKALLTPSCTAALEMAAILIDIQPGDEVIMPSYTFVSTANAFVLRGAKIVFVDIRPDTMNIDENLIEQAITPKTKAIVPVHYAGVACEMDTIMDIAERHNLYVIEDAAQGMMSTYKGRALGTIGHLGTYSFHATKNYTSGGEGGLLIINRSIFNEQSEVIREKGTNRSQFLEGSIDKYTWVDIGSSFLPSELQASYLMASLDKYESINDNRLSLWWKYYDEISSILSCTDIKHSQSIGNGHIFFLKFEDLDERGLFRKFMKGKGIECSPHYEPLHTAPSGCRYGRFHGFDKFTTIESRKIIRLPIFNSMKENEQGKVIDAIRDYINER